jgi:Transposase DDE domain
MIQKNLAKRIGAFCDTIHMADGLPIPVCKFARANFSRIFEGDAAYGYWASKKETYYGFKGNVSISSERIITGITVTPANIDERESLLYKYNNMFGRRQVHALQKAIKYPIMLHVTI